MFEEIKKELNKSNLKSSRSYVIKAKDKSIDVTSYLSKAKDTMSQSIKTSGTDQALNQLSNINKNTESDLYVAIDFGQQAIDNFDK